jgi:uroporphyrinogen III methyltransferase/synthase
MQTDNLPYNSIEKLTRVYKVASRTSNLALKQAEEISGLLPGLNFTLLPMQSFGDKNKQISLIDNNINDIFTRELDEALLNGDADLAIHSAKDLPYPLPDGLEVIALTGAFDKTDVLVSRTGKKLDELPSNPKLGTSSLLRKAELLKIRTDIEIVSIRGTIEERIEMVDNGTVDAIIVAGCALKRLGLEKRIAEILPFETHPLQGNLAIVAKKGDSKLRELFSPIDIRRQYGRVCLVGFGPGDPDLLTIKGHKLLQHADIIYFDDLTNHKFLQEFEAEKIYVGKRKNNHSFEQEEINKLIYHAAIQGRNVVRLKGGDPMIFAHGGEEIEYLTRNLVEVSVVPGITTALAASANSGIPLTHRDIASSVTFLTGHTNENINIPLSGTVVIYMGATNLQTISRKAIEQGRDQNTPVMLAYNVSKPDEEIKYSTLHALSISETKYKTPLVIIIGEISRLHPNHFATGTYPVYLVTGTKSPIPNPFTKVIHSPMIEISSIPENELPNLAYFITNADWILFTSRYTVHYFFEILNKQGNDARILGGIKIASIGKTTSAELLKHSIIADLQPELESSEGLIRLFAEKNITNQHIFIPRSKSALSLLPEGLTKLGNNVSTADIYRNTEPKNMTIPSPEEFDVIIFSSPSGVDNFFKRIDFPLDNKKFIVRGNETRKRLLEKNINRYNILNTEAYETFS